MAIKIETYPYDITCEWHYNDRLVIIKTAGDTSKEGIDTWADLAIGVLQKIPKDDNAFFILDDVSRATGMNPYTMKRSQEVLKAVPRREKLYIATVLADSFLNKMVRVLLLQFLSWKSSVKSELFLSREEADAWVLAQMQKEGIITEAEALDFINRDRER